MAKESKNKPSDIVQKRSRFSLQESAKQDINYLVLLTSFSRPNIATNIGQIGKHQKLLKTFYSKENIWSTDKTVSKLQKKFHCENFIQKQRPYISKFEKTLTGNVI